MARHLMNRLFKLQFLGSFVLFAATLCAELAARALQYAPSSELPWFINLRIFGIFQRSHALLSEFVPIFSSSALYFRSSRSPVLGSQPSAGFRLRSQLT